jgi:hypothetical protein
MPENTEEYSYFVKDPTLNFKGQELSFDNQEEFAQKLSENTGIPIIDLSKSLTKLFNELSNNKPTPTPPPVPSKEVSSSPPTEILPVLPAVADSPQLQGAPDVEPKIIVDIRPSEGQISRPRLLEYYWDIVEASVPRSAEELVSRVSPQPANTTDFDALVRQTLRNERPREPHPSHAVPAARTPAADADPVDLFTGAFTINVVDLVVPTAHIPITMSRSYRSGRPYYGPFGFGWDHVYNVYLRELNDGRIALWNGQLREQHFCSSGDGFEPEPGLAARL